MNDIEKITIVFLLLLPFVSGFIIGICVGYADWGRPTPGKDAKHD